MKKSILILNEKYCDTKPELGLSNSFHNIITSYAKSRNDNLFHVIHHDESLNLYGKHVDTFLLNYCIQYNIRAIIIMLAGGSPSNPSVETYQSLKDHGIHLSFFWPDSGLSPNYGILMAQELSKFGLQYLWDNPCSPQHNALPFNPKIIKLWVPQDLSFFYPSEQTIDVRSIGSRKYPDRTYFLSFLKGVAGFVSCGGQREDMLGMDEYAKFIRSSKISINFSLSLAQFYQTKGRIFEIFASKSMLLEYRNPSTSQLFEAGKDYIDFSEPKELLDKINYYLYNEKERLDIAESGYQKYMTHYTAKHYWDIVVENIENDKT